MKNFILKRGSKIYGEYSCGHWDEILTAEPFDLNLSIETLEGILETVKKFKICKACWKRRLNQPNNELKKFIEEILK